MIVAIEFYLALWKNQIMKLAGKWMGQETITVHVITQTLSERQKLHHLFPMQISVHSVCLDVTCMGNIYVMNLERGCKRILETTEAFSKGWEHRQSLL